MKPLIVAATREEILPSIQLLEQHEVPYLITGVGMTATAYALGKYLQANPVSLIINVGIAGALDFAIQIGDLVSIRQDIFAELGAEDDQNFIPIDEMNFGTSLYYSKIAEQAELPIYNAITVNKVHGNAKSIARVKSLFPTVQIESMEGAAVFYAAHQENIDCLQIRAISNYVEKRNKNNWNIPLALENLNNWLKDYVLKKQ